MICKVTNQISISSNKFIKIKDNILLINVAVWSVILVGCRMCGKKP